MRLDGRRRPGALDRSGHAEVSSVVKSCQTTFPGSLAPRSPAGALPLVLQPKGRTAIAARTRSASRPQLNNRLELEYRIPEAYSAERQDMTSRSSADQDGPRAIAAACSTVRLFVSGSA